MIEVSTNIKLKNGTVKTITVELDDDLGTWLITQPQEIVHDFVLSEYRRNNSDRAYNRRTQSLDETMKKGFEPMSEDDPTSGAIQECETKELKDAIAKLTSEQQWLVEQVFYLKRKKIDIAAELGITKQAVSSQLRTIRDNLKKFLKNF